MNVNSRSEAIWQILHQAKALFTDGGFATALPPMPSRPAQGPKPTGFVSRPTEGYDDLAARFAEHMEFGTTWPEGLGTAEPLALILTQAPLSKEALDFVRTWFENPKVNLVVAETFFLQPLPLLGGEKPPYQDLARALCSLFQPKVLLSLGSGPAQKLLGAPLSLDSLRGSDYRFDRWTMVTTLDPEEFLTLADEDKARFKAQLWKDLQRLLGKLRYG